MINDISSAVNCYSIYWDIAKFDKIIDQNGIYCGIRANAVTFRGSTTRGDWVRDLESVDMTNVPGIGRVGEGFYKGMPETFDAIMLHLDPTQIITVTGHSLGAAHAQVFACMVKQKYPDAQVEAVVFGCPRTGEDSFRSSLSRIVCRSYVNGDDIVTKLPRAVPGRNPVQAADLISVYCEPIEFDAWVFARDHHCQLYVTALARAVF